MTKAENNLRRIALLFRRGVLQGRKSSGCCWNVCAPLHGFLCFYGHECDLTEGWVRNPNVIGKWESHYWITFPDGRILDPTADQFSKLRKTLLPKVHIGPKPRWYRTSKERGLNHEQQRGIEEVLHKFAK